MFDAQESVQDIYQGIQGEAIRLAGQSDQPVTQVARKLGLRVNQIYKWPKQLEEKQGNAFSGKRTATDKDAKIRYFHQTSRDTYGSPRICEDLVRAGEHIGKNTVALLMQRAGIAPKTGRKFRVTTDSRKTVPAPNRLEREFVAKYPNQRWVSDITFIPTRQG